MHGSVDDPRARLQKLPKVDEVMRRPEIAALDLPRWAVLEAVRREVDSRRRAILAGEELSAVAVELPSPDVVLRARELMRPSLRPVVNATGVVLHTNLGRAPLADRAVERIGRVARGYSNLEYQLDGRARGSRHDHLRGLLCELTGAEAAVVVNNNAAAVLLSLAALAAEREVVVSRGELIEIGGSFRVPDVMRASGARLVEVGTTNKTHPRDYEGAIGPATGLLLKVHRSNFAVVGFTEEVAAADLVAIGRARGVPVMIDLGSGTLLDPHSFPGAGLPAEPTVGAQVASGAQVVTFSGDKLLGGPQAGVIVGEGAVLERIRRHPLMRAVRPDKLTLAALEATLEIYRDARALVELPALRMLAATPEGLRARAERLLGMIAAPARGSVRVVEVTSAVGGGALPLAEPTSFALAVGDAGGGGGAAGGGGGGGGRSAEALDRALRGGDPPVVGRIADGRLLLDVRTMADEEMASVATAVMTALNVIPPG
jgi:L-seryl-tRNA(Ser) seleniumtransferase